MNYQFRPGAVSAVRKITRLCTLVVSLMFCGNLSAATLDGILNKVDAVKTDTNTLKTRTSNIQNATTGLQDRLDNLYGNVAGNIGVEFDPATTQKFLEAVEDIKAAVATENAAVAAFGDGTSGDGCFLFRADLRSLMSNLLIVADSLKSVGDSSVSLTQQDFALLDQLPCKVLYIANKAFEETPLGEMVDRLERAALSLQLMLPLLVVSAEEIATDLGSVDVAAFSNDLSSARTSDRNSIDWDLQNRSLIHTRTCEALISPSVRRIAISTAALAAKTVSVRLQIIAAIVDTESITGLSEIRELAPVSKEVTGGAWGFASLTLERSDPGHKIAGGLNAVAKVIDGLVDATNSKLDICMNTHNQRLMFEELQSLKADMAFMKEELCSLTRYRSARCANL